MNISESVDRVMGCRNAKPPINHDIKRKEEQEIKDQTAEFLAKGGEVELLQSNNRANDLTFKQKNDSTYKN